MMDGYRTYRLEKLVRDRAPETMRGDGSLVDTRTLSEADFKAQLLSKLGEEVCEVQRASAAELPEELADVLELIKSLAETSGSDLAAIEALRQAKADRRGGFGARIYIDAVHCPQESFWDRYFSKDPELYGLSEE